MNTQRWFLRSLGFRTAEVLAVAVLVALSLWLDVMRPHVHSAFDLFLALCLDFLQDRLSQKEKKKKKAREGTEGEKATKHRELPGAERRALQAQPASTI